MTAGSLGGAHRLFLGAAWMRLISSLPAILAGRRSAAAGTRMRWSWDVRPRGAVKVMTPLVGAIGRRQKQGIWGALKRLLELAGEGV